jgi:hypothetical protein
MGQIDSFKKVLGITDQSSGSPATVVEMKEEKVQEQTAEAPRPRKKQTKAQHQRTTLAVSIQTREEIHVLSFWAQRQKLTDAASSESLLRIMLDIFYEKYPKAKRYVEYM